MTSVRRLFVLLCGYEILPKTISTRDRGERFIMSEPISGSLPVGYRQRMDPARHRV